MKSQIVFAVVVVCLLTSNKLGSNIYHQPADRGLWKCVERELQLSPNASCATTMLQVPTGDLSVEFGLASCGWLTDD